jgi:C4-dicarboxylate transporter DctM subunit
VSVVLWALPLALLSLGLPIYVVALATAIVLLVGFMDVPLTQLHLTMFGSVDKFALLAVPFFIFAGELMSRGGISRRIVDWVVALMGGVRGSLGLTAVGANAVFGAISGSSVASVAAIGKLLYQPLRERGYDERFAAGVLTSTGAIATIIPPSITMILYGAAAEQSIAALFAAGIIPGLVIAAATGLYVVMVANIRDVGAGERFHWPALLGATARGIWALGTPVIVLGGIYAGLTSPTEAGGIACVYAILVTRFIYREIDWRGIWDVAVASMYLTAQVLIIVAATGVFSWLLTVSGVPASLTQFIADIQASPIVVIIVINLFLLLVGCFIDPSSAILVLTPLLLPIATRIGVDPIHFGIIMTVNLSIGMFTPPFGLNIFVAQATLRTPLKVLYAGLMPFIAVNILCLVLITFVPELSLLLARGLR